MRRKTARQIDAEAAIWAARVDRGPMSGEQEEAFQAWLSGDARRLGAFGRMRALAFTTERARAFGTGFKPADFAPRPSRRKVLRVGGIAAAVTLVSAASWKLYRRVTQFQTAKGEIKVVALEDGSVITLNTASSLAVRYSDRQRSIVLFQGEALFDVAKDRGRPFLVAAGNTQVKVVGTSFTVKRLDFAPVQVLVREGLVEVSKPEDLRTQPIHISANTRAVALQNDATIAARAVAPSQLHRELAWQDGRIAFEGQTLSQAAAEFARYSDTRLVINDPELAREEIAGLFKANDPVGFAQKIAISLNAHAKVSEGQVELTR